MNQPPSLNGFPQNFSAAFSKLRDSRTYHVMRKAFVDLTGLPLTLEPVAGSRGNEDHTGPCNDFCILLNDGALPSCANCHHSRLQPLFARCAEGAYTLPCSAGLQHMFAPIRFGSNPIGFLVTGQFSNDIPNDVPDCGDHHASSQSVLNREGSHSALNLLHALANHLSIRINAILLEIPEDASDIVVDTIDCLERHTCFSLSLLQAAQSLPAENRLELRFRESLGIGFNDYLVRRTLQPILESESADLRSPRRISPVMNAGNGFQLLRMFHDYLGERPEEYFRRATENHQLLTSWSREASPYPVILRS